MHTGGGGNSVVVCQLNFKVRGDDRLCFIFLDPPLVVMSKRVDVNVQTNL